MTSEPDLHKRLDPRLHLILAVSFLPALLGCRPVVTAQAQPARPTPAVEVLRTPDGGIQPQAVTDAHGVTHLIYYGGEAGAGDLFYRRRAGVRAAWSDALRVNGVPGSAVAAGTIRGGQLAIGKNGRIHVVWFGSDRSGHRGPEGSAPLLYARLNDAGTAFEPEKNLMRSTTELDGGPSVAADRSGNVYVAWHASERKGAGEENRRLWLARSADDGKTWAREVAVNPEPSGACPCCSTKVFADREGAVYVLYRAAKGKTDRGMVLLTSTDHGTAFRSQRVDPWNVDT